MKKYDVNKVPRSVLEDFVRHHADLLDFDMSMLPLSFLRAFVSRHECIFNPDVSTTILKYSQRTVREAARVTLRTRAQVDADIAEAIREYRRQWLVPLTYNSRFDYKDRKDIYLGEVVNPLIAEETEG